MTFYSNAAVRYVLKSIKLNYLTCQEHVDNDWIVADPSCIYFSTVIALDTQDEVLDEDLF